MRQAPAEVRPLNCAVDVPAQRRLRGIAIDSGCGVAHRALIEPTTEVDHSNGPGQQAGRRHISIIGGLMEFVK